MNRLLNKVAIITGADGGICGKASELFCQEGAKVVMCDIDPHVEEKCAEIVAAGGHYLGALFLDVGVDVAHNDFCTLLAEKLAGLAADSAVSAGDYSNFIEKTVHLYFPSLFSPYCGS